MRWDEDGHKVVLLHLLAKLDVIEMRSIKHSIAHTMISYNGSPYLPPPLSIQLPITGLYIEYLQWVPKGTSKL